MGKVYIKKENGKEVAYEEGWLIDKKIGELDEMGPFSDYKKTQNLFGTEIKVSSIRDDSGKREAEIDGEKGYFSIERGLFGLKLEKHPTFNFSIERGLFGLKLEKHPTFKKTLGYSNDSHYESTNVEFSSSLEKFVSWITTISLMAGIGYCINNRSAEKHEFNYQPRVNNYEQVKPKTKRNLERKINKEIITEGKIQAQKPKNLEELVNSNFKKTEPEKVIQNKQYKENEDYYKNISPGSDFAKNTPNGYAPAVKETKDGKGNIIRENVYLKPEEANIPITQELSVYYPETGNSYLISKEKYPEFYRKIDLNKDGKITMLEIGESQEKLITIIQGYKEGDVDSIVRTYILLYK